MSVFTEQVLVDKLNHMSNSQQSIETLSHWLMYHRKHAEKSVKIWEREIFKAPRDRKLLYIFLANHVMQSSRKKGPEFIKEFSQIMKQCIVHVYRESNVQKEILRILDVWKDRTVLSVSLIEEIRRALVGEKKNYNPSPQNINLNPPPTTSQAQNSEMTQTPTVLSTLPTPSSSYPMPTDPNFLSIVESLMALQASEMSHLFLQDEISSLLAGNELQPEKLQMYINELALDIEKRTTVVNKLTNFLEEHRALLVNRQSLLNQLVQTAQTGPEKRKTPPEDEEHESKKQKGNNYDVSFESMLPPSLVPPMTGAFSTFSIPWNSLASNSFPGLSSNHQTTNM